MRPSGCRWRNACSTPPIARSASWCQQRLAGILRTKILARIAAFAMSFARVQGFAFRTVSQTGIHYRASPLSQTADDVPKDAPRAGDRFPWLHVRLRADGPVEDLYDALDDTQFNLLVIGQAADAVGGLDSRLRGHIVSGRCDKCRRTRACLPQPSFYLLRPDGHVGLCGTRLERCHPRHFSEHLAMRA